MKKINIPADVEKELNKNVKKDLIKIIIILTLFASLAVFLELILLHKARISIRILGYALMIFIFSLIMRKQFSFRDHSFNGIIEEVKIKETKNPGIKGGYLDDLYTYSNNIILNIKTENEHKVVSELFRRNTKYREFVDYYKQGDHVIYLKGSKYVYRVPSKPDDAILCVICGGLNLQTNSKCVFCSHTLLNEHNYQ